MFIISFIFILYCKIYFRPCYLRCILFSNGGLSETADFKKICEKSVCSLPTCKLGIWILDSSVIICIYAYLFSNPLQRTAHYSSTRINFEKRQNKLQFYMQRSYSPPSTAKRPIHIELDEQMLRRLPAYRGNCIMYVH